jgi:hypothetical protein
LILDIIQSRSFSHPISTVNIEKYPPSSAHPTNSLQEQHTMYSKKEQKHVERTLIELMNDRVNGNKCGECSATFPTWASVNLGVFLCGRCASLHRKLGEEVSIVKSLTLDKWSQSDLDSVGRIGNKRAKKIWNPKNEPFPFDDDDKEELFQFVRNKYVLGKFRYSEPTQDDYNLGKHGRSNRRDRFNSNGGSSVPRLSRRDVPEIERFKYRKLEPKLQDKGFNNIDDNYEALSLAKGDISFAVEILSLEPTNSTDDSNEKRPRLPQRPGAAAAAGSQRTGSATSLPQPVQQSTASNSEWWANSTPQSAPATATATATTTFSNGLLEPPQQYLDPNTGIIYVDPVQQQLYEQQQAQLSQQAAAFSQVPQYQTGFQQPQQTGLNKSQLLSLYSTGGQQQQQQQLQQQQQPLQGSFTAATDTVFPNPQFSQSTGSVFQQPQQPQAQQQSFYGQQPGQYQQFQYQ